MQALKRIPQPLGQSLEQRALILVQRSTKLNHFLQIHALLIKTSLTCNNHVLAKLLPQLLSSSSANLPYARSLFDETPSPDTFLYNCMIMSCSKSHHSEVGLSLFLNMRLRKNSVVAADGFTYFLAVQACGKSGDLRVGRIVHAEVSKLGFDSGLIVATVLIEMYAKCDDMESSKRLFDALAEPDLVCCNVMLAWCVRVREMKIAREVFEKMPERDLVTWNTMIHGYASLGDIAAAKMIFDVAAERDVVSWSSMIAAYAKSRQSNEALKLFHEMQLANVVVPDRITMVSVLSACGDAGALGMGKMAHEFIVRNKIGIDLKLGTALVDMYARCGDMDISMRVFNEMNSRDVFAWSAIIMGLGSHGFAEVALHYFSKMIEEGIKPNDITFIGVLSACSHGGLVDEGRACFRSMAEVHGLSPKVEHYGCMVDILGRAGRLQEAMDLIRAMPFEADAVVWRTLLGACRMHKNVELAEEAIANLLKLEPLSDGSYVLSSNLYSLAKKWNKVSDIRRMMKNGKIQKVPGSSSIEVNNTVYEFVAGDRSNPKFTDICKMLDEVIDRLKIAGYKPVTAAVVQDFSEHEKENALAYHSEKLAIAFGLLTTAPGSTIRVIKNLRVCEDCHLTVKFISKVYCRNIIVRDRTRFHHFVEGSCSCKDYW
uniref:DYW domain-containing protein n=1 Tax=Kalanchoe fedtschenkoi TaxID=63787 RepID=A0A7N0ULG8_KALFE